MFSRVIIQQVKQCFIRKINRHLSLCRIRLVLYYFVHKQTRSHDEVEIFFTFSMYAQASPYVRGIMYHMVWNRGYAQGFIF